jgi:hypothetical protein
MSRQAKSPVGQPLDSDKMITLLREAYKEENLIQMILYAHLFIEHGITQKIAEKLERPEIIKDGKYGRWPFYQKISLYVGLVNPPKDREDLLFAFNNLRNRIAHTLEDERECVWEFLPWKDKEKSKPDALTHLLLTTTCLLEGMGVIDVKQYFSQE